MSAIRLSKQALERIEQLSKSRKMTPSEVILKLLPEPKEKMTEEKAWAALEKRDPRQPKISETEANRIADEAVRKVREARAKRR